MTRVRAVRVLTGSALVVVVLLGVRMLPASAEASGAEASPTPVVSPEAVPTPSDVTTAPSHEPTTSPGPPAGSSEHGSPRGGGVAAGEERTAKLARRSAAVQLVDSEFRPLQLTVAAGTTVVWTNDGEIPHTVNADDGSFDSGTLQSGETFSTTLDQAGSIPYYCEIHGGPGGSGMSAVVLVRAAPGGGGDRPSTSSGPGDLARTGMDPIPLAIVALASGIAGLGLIRLGGRRRRPTPGNATVG